MSGKNDRHRSVGIPIRRLASSLLLVAVLLIPQIVFGHPMGNFSINHFSALELHPTVLRLTYVIDMAEIPTFQEIQEHGLTAQAGHPSAQAYRERKVAELTRGLALEVAGKSVALTVRSSDITFPPGAGGLPTLRLAALLEAPITVFSGTITYEDRNYPQRVGWKEMTATAENGVTLLESSVPTESRSKRLTAYAPDLLQSPPQNVRASLAFGMTPMGTQARAGSQGTPGLAAQPAWWSGQTARPLQSGFTELIAAPEVSVQLMLLSFLVAIGLGAFHALEPGHGKTLMAAYLVGARGTARHALLLGLAVTASHTLSVYALGGVTLFASEYVLPDRLYPWLGVVSGLLITVTGLLLFRKVWHRRHLQQPHRHEDHHPDHHHHDDAHGHSHHSERHEATDHPSTGSLLSMGITGGMIPCPAALVVLLSAVALHRIGFGLLLIVAFSLGLAMVLVGIGLLVVYGRGFAQRWSGDAAWVSYMPFVSPLLITPLGLVVVLTSLIQSGVLPGPRI